MPSLADYVDITALAARQQWARVLARPARPNVQRYRQENFMPAETLLCLAASLVVNHLLYGGSTAQTAPTPVPELAALFRRTPASILAKLANLDGSRPHGARYELETASILLSDPARLAAVYSVVMAAARASGIRASVLPDFLPADLRLLGQEELSQADVEGVAEARLAALARKSVLAQLEVTERLLMAAVRVGQHRFAVAVLANCGSRCAFCGLHPEGELAGKGLLLASHIKPWRDSSEQERLDVANGLAACPSHDAAFDAGLLWVNGGLGLHRSSSLEQAATNSPSMAYAFGEPPLRASLLLPAESVRPGDAYLAWHRQMVAGITPAA